jgi:hypothetical protein
LYSDILTHAREVERRAHAVILVGTYEAATDNESMPNANVSVIGFFPKFSDPAAIKRHQLAVPAKICLNEAWNNFCADVKSLPSM